MSSATSIDRSSVSDRAAAAADGPARDVFRPWHFFVLVSLIGATVAVMLARQASPEHLILISITIGAAGFAAAALYRTLVPLVAKDPGKFQASLTDGMRAILEREKGLVLRSITELEFDRAMGKVSAKDFDEMAGRLRTRAITLMRQLDADGGGYRELIERELTARLPAAAARKPSRMTVSEPAPSVPATEHTGAPAATAAGTCTCGTPNDRDAVFCKRCGTKLLDRA
jgi:hypothetical protein